MREFARQGKRKAYRGLPVFPALLAEASGCLYAALLRRLVSLDERDHRVSGMLRKPLVIRWNNLPRALAESRLIVIQTGERGTVVLGWRKIRG